MAVDRKALAALAARSLSRAFLSGRYCCLMKSQSLFRHGYSVLHWFDPFDKHVLLEMNPRTPHGQADRGLPRVTVTNYADQCAFHKALGLGVVPTGDEWSPRANASPGLFDAQYQADATPGLFDGLAA